MLIYILIAYTYHVYALPATSIHPPCHPPSVIGTSTPFPSSSLVDPFVSSLSNILPRAISGSGRNMCSAKERGLFDIIWNCAITLLACIYNSLHPNVPSQELGWWARQWIKVKLALYMLIAPELIVFWAAAQWAGAKRIAKEMNAIDKGTPRGMLGMLP